jgi:hypothetical protein
MADTFANAMAIGGLPVPVAAIALLRTDGPCFLGLESRNPNRLRLISFRTSSARTRACARLQGRSPLELMRRWRCRTGPVRGSVNLVRLGAGGRLRIVSSHTA